MYAGHSQFKLNGECGLMTEVFVQPTERINFSPSSTVEEVIQNVGTLLATVRYSVPFDREFGLNPEYLDDPSIVSRSKLIADIVEKINKYEPRATVLSVDFEEDGEQGTLKPTVKVDIND